MAHCFGPSIIFDVGKSSIIPAEDLAELIKIELGDLLSEEAKNSNLFKMIQVNSYCGKAGLGEFKYDSQLKIDEYLSKANLVRSCI